MKHHLFSELEIPIIQAPMAGVQDSALAIAVSLAGGLGSLPCSMLGIDGLRDELAFIKSKIDKPINVNFFSHDQPEFNPEQEESWRLVLKPYFDEYGLDINNISTGGGREPFSHAAADVLEEFKPEFVSFHFGLPEKGLMQRVKTWGAKVLSSATTVEEAQWLEAHGADGIIAQGIEAGGHRGMFLTKNLSIQPGTFELLPKIVEQVSVPVIAAGGITDAKGVAHALSLGATAVQLGTVYLLCDEAKTSAVHRAAIKGSVDNQTSITNIFSGRPARGIVNRAIRELGPINVNTPEFPLASAAITELRRHCEQNGSSDFTPLWCGQHTAGCAEISAGELTQRLASDIRRRADFQGV
ncbi:MAG: nitronate monooxygenase [Pseudomonadales bacterium]|nr:nitronate monooxygenase [Pseudomonadales bacterium]